MIIHLLITDWFKGLLPADTPTHADLYKNLFAPVVPDAEYKVYAAMEGELPDLTNPEPGLYVITGSQAGAYETDAWEIAQPLPSKAPSTTCPSSTFN